MAKVQCCGHFFGELVGLAALAGIRLAGVSRMIEWGWGLGWPSTCVSILQHGVFPIAIYMVGLLKILVLKTDWDLLHSTKFLASTTKQSRLLY